MGTTDCKARSALQQLTPVLEQKGVINMQVHECVSFLLIQNEQILLEKRSKNKACDPNLIAIPGGHIEENESKGQALIREIKEELGVIPGTYYYLCSLYHPTTELQLIHYYVVSSWSGDISALEADNVYWSYFSKNIVDTEVDKVAISEYLRLASSNVEMF